MTRIGVRELNQHTSKYIAMVKNGETVEVTERGQLVARLVPAPRTGTVLDELVAAGRVMPATTSWHELPPPGSADDGINVADELAAMREQDRY
ncbi:MAG: type II toxin-antitoxin system Phd/YefM family antitoxin [Pseudonocardiaceae bacterium]